MQRRCNRNRNRSKRRSIYCPIHGCYLDSASQKYPLYADRAKQLQQRGISRRNALLLVSTQTTVPLEGEWIEAFWCGQCQQTQWYHVLRTDERRYELSIVPPELWEYATRVINPNGNPSVGEFTRRQARQMSYRGMRDFQDN